MAAEEKIALRFEEISRRLHALTFPEVDAVVGIRTGGVVPAAMLAHQLRLPLFFIGLNYRDEDNRPRHPAPQPTAAAPAIPAGLRRLLLVDEVSVTGSTLRAAMDRLAAPGRAFTTFVLKGRGPADLVLFPEVEPCVLWPWRE